MNVDHNPPKKIACDNPWVIEIDICIIPYETLGSHIDRCKDVTIHIRDSSNNSYTAVPMIVEKINRNLGRMDLKADMKPIPCDSNIGYVEYYIDYMFGRKGYKYYRTDIYRVNVSNK
ncbi:MAG: hypothetical protein ABSF37_10845 [Sedimentisphaerales bacterium]